MVTILQSPKIEKQRHLNLELPLSAIKGIKNDALRTPAPTDPFHMKIFLTAAKMSVYRHLSAGILSVFDDIRNLRITPPTILIDNVPIDDYLPATPKDGKWSPLKKTFVSEFVLAGTMQLLGVPFGLIAEKDGRLFSQIATAEGKENDSSSLGAKVKLGFHSELVALSESGLRNDWLGLNCLRADKERKAITTVVDVRDVLPSLNKKRLDMLKKPLYKYKIPNSFNSNDSYSNPMPIIIDGNPPQMNINFGLEMCKIVDDNIEASEAFEWLDFVFETADVVREFKLQPQNLLIINNIWASHGRTTFKPADDDFGRWLQRMYVKSDLFQARNRAVKCDYLMFN
jgi:L-asparagine oxygenase